MRSSRKSKKIISFMIGLSIIIILIILLGLLNLFHSNELYRNRVKKERNTTINYPYFKKYNLNDSINKYIRNINNNLFDEINYEVNFIDSYVSILFNKSKDGKIIDYDNLIYNKNGEIANISSIVSDEELLKEKVKIYLDNNNIIINNYPSVDFDYFLTNKGIIVLLTSEENRAKIFTKVEINYNEINDILKIRYEIDKDYIRVLTTTTTTTTTTTKIPETNDNNQETSTDNKVISFTFDDGPSKYTTQILDVLDSYGAKATFFEVGYMIKNRTDTVKEVLSRGHQIGNHTTDHSNLNKLSAAKVKEKVYDNNETFKEITGMNFPLLRPPYGNCKSSVKELIDVPIIKWSVDSRDWESRNKDKIIELVKKETKSGDIVLFHDLYESTYEAIKVLVPYYYEQGYKIVTVSELFEINDLTLEDGHIYYNARP